MHSANGMMRFLTAALLGLGVAKGFLFQNLSNLGLVDFFDDVFSRKPPVGIVSVSRANHSWVVAARCSRRLGSCKYYSISKYTII